MKQDTPYRLGISGIRDNPEAREYLGSKRYQRNVRGQDHEKRELRRKIEDRLLAIQLGLSIEDIK